MALTYFTTCSREDENLPILQDAVNHLQLRYNLKIKVVRSDNEMNRIKTKNWFNKKGIDFERSAPDTYEQNGISERMGQLIMEKARAMRLSGRLPHALWREIVASATYLYNRTPRYSLDWKSPYEAFHEYVMENEGVTGPRKPVLSHLRAFGCKAYTLIKSRGDLDYLGRLQKLAPRAHIRYLIGYESTSIYRVWIPYKKKVISTRDVIFNEKEFFDGKPIRVSQELASSLDETIEKITIPEKESLEEIQLQPEEALEIGEDLEEIEQLRDIEEIDHQPEVLDLREKGYSNYPTPPATEDSTYFLENSEIAIPVKNIAASQQRLQNQEELEDKSLIDELEPAHLQKLQTQEELEDENLIDELEPAFLQELKKQKNERFYDFNQHRIPQVWQTSFETA